MHVIKIVFSAFLFLFSSSNINSQINKDSLNLIFNNIIKKYLSVYSWEERLDYVINAEKCYEHMEKRYSDVVFNAFDDTTRFAYLCYKSIVKRPIIRDRKNNNYFYKDYNTGSQKGRYYMLITENGLKIDWEASVIFSDMKIAELKNRKPKDYVRMRIFMKLKENFYKEKLPDYFQVQIQDGDQSGGFASAFVFKKSDIGQRLFEKLSSGSWVKTVAFVKYMSWYFPNDEYNPTLEDKLLIGKINSFDNTWVEKFDKNGHKTILNLENPNLLSEEKAYESFMKVKEILKNYKPSIKAVIAAKSDYYGSQIELVGYLKLNQFYFGGFSEHTYYSFEIGDEFPSAYIYFPKNKGKVLFDQLVQNIKLPVKFKVYIDGSKQSSYGIVAEGLSYEILK